MYSPTLGRFMRTDPIGYGDGMNWYNYVGSDPVNGRDPTGTQDATCIQTATHQCGSPMTIQGLPLPAAQLPASTNFQSGPRHLNPEGSRTASSSIDDTPQNKQPQPPVCPAPSNVSLSGTIVTGPAGPAYFSGTLKDVSTGRTYSVSGFGYGGGFVVGTYDVRGTVAGFNALSNGLDIFFVQGPYGSGGARFSDNNGRSIGEGSVSGAVAPPIGAGGVSFDPPRITQIGRGNC